MIDKDEIIKAARKHVSKGNIDDAIAEYLKILPYSVDGNIHNIVGDLYLKKNSIDEAIKYFREAAVIFNKDESHAKAIALYHKILIINPDLQDVVMELAELNAERGFINLAVEGMISAAQFYYSKGLPLKALGVYKRTLAICPSDTELKIKIADLHLETHHTERAEKMYMAIAMEYEANAESVKAEEMYKKVLSLNPKNIESLSHLSRLAEDDQDLELAFQYISKAAAIAPLNSEIMFDYSNLAAKANKDISEYLPQVQDGADKEISQNIQLPDAVNNNDKIDTVHEPLDLSLDNRKPHKSCSGKPISTSTSPLPITSTGMGSEETGITVPPDTVKRGIDKKGIWDEIHSEDKNNSSIIESIHEKTSDALTGHEIAEADYDQDTGEQKLNRSVKKTDHEKKENDSRRVKRRVKSSGLHVALICFFVLVTAISFIVAFKTIKKSQTVEVETPVHTIPQQPLTITKESTSGSSSDTNKASAQTNAKEPEKTRTNTIKKEDNITADNHEVINLPVRVTEPAIKESKTNIESTDNITLSEDAGNLTAIQNEDIRSTVIQDSVMVQEKELYYVDDETLSAPEMASEITLTEEDINSIDIQKNVIESAIKPESELLLENENTNIDSGTLIVPHPPNEIQQKEDHNQEGTAVISFKEHFDNNSNNWDIIQTSAAYVRMLDGKYYIQNKRQSGAYIVLNEPDISTDHDFEIETHLQSVNPSGEYSFGLVFGAKDKEDFFAFQMLSENKYSIRKYYRGVSLELAGGKINSKTESEYNFNVLKINLKENTLSFYINENYVDEVSGISFSNRKTGFFINGKTELVVDKILLHQPPR